MNRLYSYLRRKAKRNNALENLLHRHYTKRSVVRRYRVSKSSNNKSSPTCNYLLLFNYDKEKRNFLLTNKNADYAIRAISRREVNQLRRKGVDIHILGAVGRTTPNEVLAKAKKFAPLSSICVTDSSLFEYKTRITIGRIVGIRSSTKITGSSQPSRRRHKRKFFRMKYRSRSGSIGVKGVYPCAPMSIGMTESEGGGGGSSYSHGSKLDQMVYVLEKMEKDIAEIKEAIKAINSEAKVEQSEDDKLIVRLSLYFKNEDIAKRFLNSARQMKNDKEIITLLKKYRDDGRCTGTPKALWELLAEENLYKTGYTNWNAQLNKR